MLLQHIFVTSIYNVEFGNCFCVLSAAAAVVCAGGDAAAASAARITPAGAVVPKNEKNDENNYYKCVIDAKTEKPSGRDVVIVAAHIITS